MYEKSQIPDPLWKEMIDFYGYEKAYDIASKMLNNYHLLVLRLTNDKFKKKYKISLFQVIIIALLLFWLFGYLFF